MCVFVCEGIVCFSRSLPMLVIGSGPGHLMLLETNFKGIENLMVLYINVNDVVSCVAQQHMIFVK